MPANLTIRPVAYTEVLACADLLAAHYEELATDKERMELAPWTEAYAKLDQDGALFSLGVFDQLGRAVGYSANFLSQAMHYRHLRICQNDVLYLAEQYRGGRTGLRLIRETEALAKERGARLMLWHAKQGTTLDGLLKRLGYGVQDIVYSRGL